MRGNFLFLCRFKIVTSPMRRACETAKAIVDVSILSSLFWNSQDTLILSTHFFLMNVFFIWICFAMQTCWLDVARAHLRHQHRCFNALALTCRASCVRCASCSLCLSCCDFAYLKGSVKISVDTDSNAFVQMFAWICVQVFVWICVKSDTNARSFFPSQMV